MDVDDNPRKRKHDDDDEDPNPNKRPKLGASEGPSQGDVQALLQLLQKIKDAFPRTNIDPDLRMQVFQWCVELTGMTDAGADAGVVELASEQSGGEWTEDTIAAMEAQGELFVEAAREGNLPQLKAMLEACPELSTETHAEARALALRCAARSGHVDVVHWLLKNNLADPWTEQDVPNTSLCCAVEAGWTAMLELLVAKVPSFEPNDNIVVDGQQKHAQSIRKVAVNKAIELGRNGMLVILLEPALRHGAHESDHVHDWLPLAISWGHEDVIQTVLEHIVSIGAAADLLPVALQETTRRKRTSVMTRLLRDDRCDDEGPAMGDACRFNNAVAIELFTSDEFKALCGTPLVGIATCHGTFNHIEATWAATQDQLLDLVHAGSPGPLHNIAHDAGNATIIVQKVVECCKMPSMQMAHRALCMLGMRALLAKVLLPRVVQISKTHTLFGEVPTAKQRLAFDASVLLLFDPLAEPCSIDFDSAYADAGLAQPTVLRLQESARAQLVSVAQACKMVIDSTLGEPLADLVAFCHTHGAAQGELTEHLRTCGFSELTAKLIAICCAASGKHQPAFCNKVEAGIKAVSWSADKGTPPDESCLKFRTMEQRMLLEAVESMRKPPSSSSSSSTSLYSAASST